MSRGARATPPRTRAIASLVDATLFLLLVTVAVGALTLAPVAPVTTAPAPDAGASLQRLQTVTANPEYSLASGARHADESLVAFPRESGPTFDRYAHGSVASLLADAAVGNLIVDGRAVTHTGDGFERRVVLAARNATGPRVHVRAVWTPYAGAPVRGCVAAGPTPPPGARVSTAAATLDSGFPPVRDRALRAAQRDGYAGVARVVARATVRGLFPPTSTARALRGDYPVDALVTYRYRRVAALLGTSVRGPVERVEPRAANTRLSRALAAALERDLRRSFDSPVAAARAVEGGEVRVVVRRWARA
ncbi:hypothetical protein N0B31_01440 [Salinirubellus salinus]|uniref:Uncharacterized protein n=1 Tax=Salinirubellus salinus TaxID=1364945 RepID=A0A9E7R498_9EURY|nr:hypothetical protein [Salinirubellus salinus]UWM54954.1 hypothetical protein N0B31_01440 [Salinirubellus salinus]